MINNFDETLAAFGVHSAPPAESSELVTNGRWKKKQAVEFTHTERTGASAVFTAQGHPGMAALLDIKKVSAYLTGLHPHAQGD